jgi:hypothetical protein
MLVFQKGFSGARMQEMHEGINKALHYYFKTNNFFLAVFMNVFNQLPQINAL